MGSSATPKPERDGEPLTSSEGGIYLLQSPSAQVKQRDTTTFVSRSSNKKSQWTYFLYVVGFAFVVFRLFQGGYMANVVNAPQVPDITEYLLERMATTSDLTSGGKAYDDDALNAGGAVAGLKFPKVLAIYFPQYHPDTLNDRLWGINFTDWNSLKKAPPKNRMGYQIPRPTELGYYDLRDYAIRKKQGDLAKEYDIDGFVIHHYWFYDKAHPGPNLHAPVINMLKDGEPNLPFFFNWCAVTWAKKWFNKAKTPGRILQHQYWDPTDAMIVDHYQWLKQFFKLPNYIKVKGEPVFMLYLWNKVAPPILRRLRQLAIDDGYPGLYFLFGRDGSHYELAPQSQRDPNTAALQKTGQVPLDLFPRWLANESLTYPFPKGGPARRLEVPEWCLQPETTVPRSLFTPTGEMPGLLNTFDNTPRRDFGDAAMSNVGDVDEVVSVFRKNVHAAVYYETCCLGGGRSGLQGIIDFEKYKKRGGFIVINAWNEWGESMSLEPSDIYGRKFLEAIRGAKADVKRYGCNSAEAIAIASRGGAATNTETAGVEENAPMIGEQATIANDTSVVGDGDQVVIDGDARLPMVMAIFFPQYHPDPLNDKLWGEGFTDWNSLRAAPERNRLGYPIPRPTELGYYDLRDVSIRKQQGDLARQYGIDGFVIHHYWFYDPTRPGPDLHAPLMSMLQDGEPNIPFFFNWGSATWAKKWFNTPVEQNGKMPGDILQRQYFNPTEERMVEHYQWLKQFFMLPNYIKVDDQPVFMCYQWNGDMPPVLIRLRQLAIADGLPGLYFILGRDGEHYDLAPQSQLDPRTSRLHTNRKFPLELYPEGLGNETIAYPYPRGGTRILKLPEWCTSDEAANTAKRTLSGEIPGLFNTFDNTPRRNFEEAAIGNFGEPDEVVDRFRSSLKAGIYYEACCLRRPGVELSGSQRLDDDKNRFLMINAWNEWGEGMSLEPSDIYGRRFLETIQEVKAEVVREGCGV